MAFDLPDFGSNWDTDPGYDWTDPGNYDLGSDPSTSWTDRYLWNAREPNSGNALDFDFGGTDWFLTDSGTDDSWLSSIFDWANSPLGTNVLSGVLGGISNAYNQDRADKRLDEAMENSNAVLYDERVKRHNASISKPMDLGMLEFKRKRTTGNSSSPQRDDSFGSVEKPNSPLPGKKPDKIIPVRK